METKQKRRNMMPDIDQAPVPEPPIVQSVSEPWWRQKRYLGLAISAVSYFAGKKGWIPPDVADYGVATGGTLFGVGFTMAQNRQAKMLASVKGVMVPPSNSILNTLRITKKKG